MPDTELTSIKMPPHSVEAEQSVLGGIMLSNDAWEDVLQQIRESDFYRHEHRVIFSVLQELAAKFKPQDVVTVTEALENLGKLDEVGGLAYLAELANNTPSAANIMAYANIVRERSVLRRLIGVSNTIADSAYFPKGRSSAELLDEAEKRVFEIADQGGRNASETQIVGDLLPKVVEQIAALHESGVTMTGVSTGFYKLDKMTLGLQPSDLIIIAGRPSMGKTSFAMNLAEHAVMNDLPVLVFSMEMPAESLAQRMLSSLGRIDQTKIRSGQLSEDDWPRLTSAFNLLQDKKLLIDDTPSLSPTELRGRARRAANKYGGQLGLILVDYLQLMQVPGQGNRVEEISVISRSLKALAKEMKVPVIALSQLNRGLEQRTDKRPVMSDLRESGAIEQDADVIMFIYRDEVYNPNNNEAKGKAEILIRKQRNGPIGDCHLAFLGQFTRFENLATGYDYEGYN